MSSVVISGDTSGAITLAAPAVAGTNTLTLPAATGTVMVSGNMPAFSAYKTGDQSITTATWTKATFGTEEFDTNSNFASSRFTPTVAGYYQINSGLYCYGTSSLTGGNVAIYKNGTIYKVGVQNNYTSSSGTFIGSVGSIVYLNGSTDYVEIYAYLNGTGTMYINEGTTGASTWVNGCMIRGA